MRKNAKSFGNVCIDNCNLENINKIKERDIYINASNCCTKKTKIKKNGLSRTPTPTIQIQEYLKIKEYYTNKCNSNIYRIKKSNNVGADASVRPQKEKNNIKIFGKIKSNVLISNIKPSTSNSAITLIALIITIIVLLILAGVTLNMIMGENGIIGKANQAKEKTNDSNIDEKVKLSILASRDNNGNLDFEILRNELVANGINLEENSYEIEEEKVILTIEDKKYEINKDGKCNISSVEPITFISGYFTSENIYTCKDISKAKEVLFDGNIKNEGYGGVLLVSEFKHNIIFSANKRIKIEAYSDVYSDSGGSSSEKALKISKYNKSTKKFDDYKNVTTKTREWYKIDTFEPGEYKIEPVDVYLRFDEWKITQ